MGAGFTSQVAVSVPYENDVSGLVAENVQEAIDEIASNSTLFTNITTFVRMLTINSDSVFKIEENSICDIIPGNNERTLLVGNAVLESQSRLSVLSNAVMTIEGV